MTRQIGCACSYSTRERLLAANFGEDARDASYTCLNLLKVLGAMYNSSVDHAVVAKGR